MTLLSIYLLRLVVLLQTSPFREILVKIKSAVKGFVNPVLLVTRPDSPGELPTTVVVSSPDQAAGVHLTAAAD